jgi:hypothetical protein
MIDFMDRNPHRREFVLRCLFQSIKEIPDFSRILRFWGVPVGHHGSIPEIVYAIVKGGQWDTAPFTATITASHNRTSAPARAGGVRLGAFTARRSIRTVIEEINWVGSHHIPLSNVLVTQTRGRMTSYLAVRIFHPLWISVSFLHRVCQRKSNMKPKPTRPLPSFKPQLPQCLIVSCLRFC